MLADEILDQRFRLGVERVIGGPHVGELGVAALGRDHMRAQQRIPGRDRLVAAVAVPELVAEPEQALAVVAIENAIAGPEIRDVGQRRIVEPFPVGALDLRVGRLELPEILA